MGIKHQLYVKFSVDADNCKHVGSAKLLKNGHFQQAYTLAILLPSRLHDPGLVSIHHGLAQIEI